MHSWGRCACPRTIDLCVQGKRHTVKSKLQNDLKPTVIANWKLWVPAQFINFSLVPPHLQVCQTSPRLACENHTECLICGSHVSAKHALHQANILSYLELSNVMKVTMHMYCVAIEVVRNRHTAQRK